MPNMRFAQCVVLVTIVFALAGCEFPEGKSLESFVPEESWFVASVDYSSATQYENLSAHIQKIFDVDSAEEITRYLGDEYTKQLIDKHGAKPLRFIFSLQPDAQARAFAINDAPAFIEDIKTGDYFEVKGQEATGVTLFEGKKTGLYGAIKGQNVFITSNKKFRDEILGLDSKKKSIVKNKNFITLAKKLPKERVGYVYLSSSQTGGEIPYFQLARGFTHGLMIYFSAEQEGFALETVALLDREKIAQNNRGTLFAQSDVYLDKEFPVKNPAFFMEAGQLSEVIELQKEALAAFPGIQKTFASSLEKFDPALWSSFNKNFVFMIEDQNKIFPAVTAVIDARGDLEFAKSVLKKIDDSAGNFIATAKLIDESEKRDSSREPYLEKLEENGINGVRLHLQKFPQNEFSIPLFEELDETWDMWYGITDDGLFFISTMSDLPNYVNNVPTDTVSTLSSTLSTHTLYQSLLPYVAEFPKTDRTFINPEPVRDWLERLIEFGEKSGHITTAERESIQKVLGYLSSIEGIISGTMSKGDMLKNRIFVKLRE